MTEPTTERYIPTDQDMRSNAIYPASRVLEEQLKAGINFPDPIRTLLDYADAIYKYTKEG